MTTNPLGKYKMKYHGNIKGKTMEVLWKYSGSTKDPADLSPLKSDEIAGIIGHPKKS